MKMDEKISRHFTLGELCVSSSAEQLAIANVPTAAHLKTMQRYLAPGLEQVREICGARAMVVTSAYRNPAVNAAVGGTATSAHPQGFAADIRVAGLSALATARLIAAGMRRGAVAIDQLILESGRSVVHVSFDPRARGMRGHQPGAAGTAIDWGFFR